ncbi:MAG: fatty acid--CoA ligase [Alphaproteobacteria bacterium]
MAYREEIETLGDIARLYGKEQPDALCFDCEGRRTTYDDFESNTNRVANALIGMGLKPGDRISFLGKNSDWYFELLVGGAKAGLVMVSVNWRLAPPEVAYILKDSASKVLFAGPEFQDLATKARAEATNITDSVEMSAAGFAAWRDAAADSDPSVPVDPQDVAVQLYTSGTTGHPKGAQLTHANLFASKAIDADATPVWNEWTADDVSLVAMPNFHIGGTGWGITGLYAGAQNYVMPEFDPTQVLDYIQNYRITKMFMVPAAMQIVVRDPKAKDTDFSCLKFMLYGASPIPLDLLRECMDMFGCGFVQMYGMTETTGTVVALPPEDHDPAGNERMRSAGKPLPGVKISIRDDNGNELPAREVGEICIHSIQNMAGYWNLPEATQSTIGQDGWLRSGDAGYMDEDGYVYIHDRVKDMIISGGENIYPAEVENALFGHPAVADVAVVGVPDQKWGEAVKAMVVLKEGASASEADLIAHARERIAAFKAPKSVDFIPELPRNPSGKILRRELRAPYWEGQTRGVA